MGSIKDALSSMSIWPKLRGAKSGALFLVGEGIGRLPSGALRTLGAKALGMRVAPTAKLCRWREIRDGHKISICEAYKGRNVVERGFNRLKNWRGLAMRSDKTARNFLAAVQLAASRMARSKL